MCYESQGIHIAVRDAIAGDRLVISEFGSGRAPVTLSEPDICVCMKSGTRVQLLDLPAALIDRCGGARVIRATFHQRERREKNAGRTPADTFWVEGDWRRAFFMHELPAGASFEVVSVPFAETQTVPEETESLAA